MPNARLNLQESRLLCLLAYLVAACAGVVAAWLLGWGSALWTAAAADLVATVVVFAFSVAVDNSSMYDPYWSVAPVPILAFWMAASGGITARQLVVLVLAAAWAVRLTMNWLRRWRGLADEDWRYADYRRLGAAYWPVSFLGFHLFPTVIVFLGCVAAYPAFGADSREVGILDAAAVIVTLTAIVIEAAADRQLRRFLASRKNPGQVLDSGLWALSRHPNYFGEVLFWWGVYLFGLAANPGWWWMIIGPAAMTGLFLGISIPMMDKRMLARHPSYARLIGTRSAFIPLPLRTGAK